MLIIILDFYVFIFYFLIWEKDLVDFELWKIHQILFLYLYLCGFFSLLLFLVNLRIIRQKSMVIDLIVLGLIVLPY